MKLKFLLGFLLFSGAMLLPVLHHFGPRAIDVTEVAEARTSELGEGRIRYQRSAQDKGPPNEALLFLHGFNSELAVWNAVWPYLGGCAQSVRIDIPGFGGSLWPSNDYSLSAQAKRVILFLDALGIKRATLIGASMGGSLAAWMAATYPERVKGLVLMAPSGFPGSLHSNEFFGYLYGKGPFNALATFLSGSAFYRHLYPDSLAAQALTVTASYGEPWAAALKKIHAPTKILWSSGDQTVTYEYADDVSNAIAGSSLVTLPADVGHDTPNQRAEIVAKVACQVHLGTPDGK